MIAHPETCSVTGKPAFAHSAGIRFFNVVACRKFILSIEITPVDLFHIALSLTNFIH
jgi:hypothetical protein